MINVFPDMLNVSMDQKIDVFWNVIAVHLIPYIAVILRIIPILQKTSMLEKENL